MPFTGIRAATCLAGTGWFMGSSNIELGVNPWGSFGATRTSGCTKFPKNFNGRQYRGWGGSDIGMVADASGFGVGKDLRVDYFMPGTKFEGYSFGYKMRGRVTKTSNAAAMGTKGRKIKNPKLAKTADATTFNFDVQVGQLAAHVTYTLKEKSATGGVAQFMTTVTLKNTGKNAIQDVRFCRAFDPDNTIDVGGTYTTTNKVELLMSAGDKITMMSSKSSHHRYTSRSGGKAAAFFWATTDKRAVIVPNLPRFMADAFQRNYNSQLRKGYSIVRDAAMGMTFKVGTLKAGQETSMSYVSALDSVTDVDAFAKEVEKEVAAEKCAHEKCFDWTCKQWCECYDQTKIKVYNANGCHDDGDDTCEC